MAIKSSAKIAEKWNRRAVTSSDDYREGVEDTSVDWEGRTAAQESEYNAGVQAAIARSAFSKGVSRAGNSKWRDKTVKVGVGRWAPGITASVQEYAQGFEPYRNEIERLQASIPPRKHRGSPENRVRQDHFTEALHKLRVGA